MSFSLGLTAIVNIVLTLAGIALCWWALQSVKFDLFLSNPQGVQAKVLIIVLSIVLGHGITRFLSDYAGWSQMLTQLF
jgi:uncharacterized integral membrane protein (TIGR02327 family)